MLQSRFIRTVGNRLILHTIGYSMICSSSIALATDSGSAINTDTSGKDYTVIATKLIEKKNLNESSLKIKDLASDLKTKDLNSQWKKETGLWHYGYYGITLVPNVITAPFSLCAIGLSVMSGSFGPPLAVGLFGGMHFSSFYIINQGMDKSSNNSEALGYALLSWCPFLVVGGFMAMMAK